MQLAQAQLMFKHFQNVLVIYLQSVVKTLLEKVPIAHPIRAPSKGLFHMRKVPQMPNSLVGHVAYSIYARPQHLFLLWRSNTLITGLQKTPIRAAKAFTHFIKGYSESVERMHKHTTTFCALNTTACNWSVGC